MNEERRNKHQNGMKEVVEAPNAALLVLERLWLRSDRPVYLRLFKYWRKIFAVAARPGLIDG